MNGGSAQSWTIWGFTEPTDARSAQSVSAHASQVDVLVTGWIALDSATARPVVLQRDTVAVGSRGATRRLALVTSWFGTGFHPEPVRRLARSDSLLQGTSRDIGRLVDMGGYDGVVLDLESLAPADTSALLAVTAAIARAVRGSGARLVAAAVPATDTVGYPTRSLLNQVDRLVVMLYDEHWPESEPGPIASPTWVRRWLGVRAKQAGADRVVAALPLYGYHWQRGRVTNVSYDDAQRTAEAAHITLVRDETSSNLKAESGEFGALWVSDTELVTRLMQEVRAAGVSQVAFWYIGLEDSEFWTRVATKQGGR